MKRLSIAPGTLALLLGISTTAAHAGRALSPEDWYRFRDVSALTMSPDGSAVAYLVTTFERESDESRGALWLVDWHGGANVQLTRGESVSAPRFSPDERFVSFLTARPAKAPTQLWVVPRRGGKPRQLSHCSGEVKDYAWSPDGRRAVLVMRAAEDKKSRAPIVIDAWHFKEDKEGYLSAATRGHLYLLDIQSGACTPLAQAEQRADSAPVFSPDGWQIAFVGNDTQEPRSAGRDQIYLVDAAAGAQPHALLSTWSPNHQHLEWSPDGRLLSFLVGDEPKYNSYITDILAVAEVPSGRVRELTRELDRAVISPKFTADGSAIEFAVEDDGLQYPARVALSSGAITRLATSLVVNEITSGAGHTAVLLSDDRTPFEVFALEDGRPRRLSDHNHALFAELALGSVEDIRFPSGDGTEIHGQITEPPGYQAGQRYPTILWIHGGPNGQDDHSLALASYSPQLERQLFATHGYVALAINYRGSTGRGAQFARAIFADWGHLEVEDLRAGVDYALAQQIADPARLGLGGWSYGGILTDYTIASDTRFRAAISGAGSANQLSMYGSDQYVLQYDTEIGFPWRDHELWVKVSYPFFHADRIRTPTLFMGGDKDFNVPIVGGEQMYQALRTLGVPTQLIVYPGQHHDLARPGFLVDRYRRYLEWMDRYLKQPVTAAPALPPLQPGQP
jgi:dipeptidyl aminopeptidase/acylaminoacyl peptidase